MKKNVITYPTKEDRAASISIAKSYKDCELMKAQSEKKGALTAARFKAIEIAQLLNPNNGDPYWSIIKEAEKIYQWLVKSYK